MPPGTKKRKTEDCCFTSCVGGSPRYITRLFLRERRASGIESIGQYFGCLPPEMLNLLFSYLDAPALSSIGATCRVMNSHAKRLWKPLCMRLALVHKPTVLCVANPLSEESIFSYDKAVELCTGEKRWEVMAARSWLYSKWRCVVCYRNCSHRVDVHFDVTLCDSCHPLFYRRKCHAKEQFSLTERDLRTIDNDSYEFLVSDLVTLARRKYGSREALQDRLNHKQRQKNMREAEKQCALVQREREVLRALESMNSSYSDIETVDARCMPYVSTPASYQYAPQQSAEDAAKWLIGWKNRQETRQKLLMAEIEARSTRCKGCRARYDYRSLSRLPSAIKCTHVLEENATKLMETIKEHFNHDILHYTRHGQLNMETGVYDMEHRSAQELFLRNERRTKLMEELEIRKTEWPSILNGQKNAMSCTYAQDFIYKGVAILDNDGNKCRLRNAKDVARVILAKACGWNSRNKEVMSELEKKGFFPPFDSLKLESHLLMDDFVESSVVVHGDNIIACSSTEVADRIAVIEGLEEEQKSSAAQRCARIYAECNRKPDITALRQLRKNSLVKSLNVKSFSECGPSSDRRWSPAHEFINCGTTTSLFGYKVTTPEAVSSLIRLKQEIHSQTKML
ncbi:unnamed protein product [Pocillopora meandrina]|uniref:F-box domain-containing protein n=1 Tax=Pocillopora meandrina TaxID=46732 RepID=A0AAU9X580_9CNID|nr:uncharacterized protein LOC131795305 isoform X1 [Pocillopora verrucosa]CAH3136847.1 unnamed protein product [Pocillopora meandrina]